MYVNIKSTDENISDLTNSLIDSEELVTAIFYLSKTINYNACGGNSLWNWGCAIVDYNIVEKVIKKYMRLVVDDTSYPEYDAPKYANKDVNQIKLVDKVVLLSGIVKFKTEKILRQLYWSTKSGIIETAFLLPRVNKKDLKDYEDTRHTAIRELLKNTGDIVNNALKGAGNALSSTSWIIGKLPYIIVGVGVIAVIKYYPEFKKSWKG